LKILVTGASGFIGRQLTRKLLTAGHNLRLLTRNKNNINNSVATNPQVEVIEGDLTKPADLDGLLDRVEIVCHLAGMLGQAGIGDDVYWAVNHQSTKNILDLCLQAKDIKRFIHCGSAGVQGPIENPPADENIPYAPTNIYETTKTEAEKAVLEYHQKHVLPVVVLRPEFVYGPEDLHVLGLFKAIAGGKFVVMGKGRSWLHPTYIDDVIQAFELALTIEQAIGQVYIIAAERAVTVRELADQIADTLGVKRPFSIPVGVGWLLAEICEFLDRLLPIEMPFNRARFKYLVENRNFDITKAKKELGYHPQFDLEKGIKATIDWYRKEGYL
jgi:nucleoside-diphosphate-sugar epimerase